MLTTEYAPHDHVSVEPVRLHAETRLRVLDGLSSSSGSFKEQLLLGSGVHLQQFTCNMLTQVVITKRLHGYRRGS